MDNGALPRPHGGKNQGPDGDVKDPPSQERGRWLRIKQWKYTPNTNQARHRETVVQRLRQRNEGTGEQRQQRAQQLQVDCPHK